MWQGTRLLEAELGHPETRSQGQEEQRAAETPCHRRLWKTQQLEGHPPKAMLRPHGKEAWGWQAREREGKRDRVPASMLTATQWSEPDLRLERVGF